MDNAFVIPEEHIVNWDAAETKLAEFTADFVIGNKTEADWDAFVEEWNSVGGAAVTEYAAQRIADCQSAQCADCLIRQ